MSEHEFDNGQKLKAIHFEDGEDIHASPDTTITVIMEHGQMANVAWALVEDDAGRVWKWNLALVLGVELEPTP